MISFSDRSDSAINIGRELSHLLGQYVTFQLFTESKSIFGVILKGARTFEKRTMTDVAASREAICDKATSNIVFVRNIKNLADGLTKMMYQAALGNVLDQKHFKSSPIDG